MTLKISIADRARIAIEAAASVEEVCGLLLGCAGRVDRVVPCANIAADPRHRFELDPVALIAAHRAARVGQAPVIGHYHSHPSGRAEPSLRDAADAIDDGLIWIIAAGAELTAWRAVRDGAVHGRFDSVTMLP